nr:DUF6485 family protein [uncultured Holophaga sp.]
MASCKGDASKCACTYLACDKRGNCCACVSYHKTKDEVPGCFFSAEGEKSYDRSRANFVRDAARR